MSAPSFLCSLFPWLACGNRTPTEIVAQDPWSRSQDFYVGHLRKHIDKIAETLAQSGYPVQSRLNRRKQCAELHTPAGEVLVQVRAHGECGQEAFPYRAVVTFSILFPEAYRDLFADLIPNNVQFQQSKTLL